MILMILSGALLGLAAVLTVAWSRAWPLLTPPGPLRRRAHWLTRWSRRTWLHLGIGAAGGIAVWAITGWTLAVVVGPAAAVGLPALLSNRGETDRIVLLEAMEEWTRALAGVLTVGIGLEQALATSARSAPPAIAEPVGRLVTRLNARWDTETAIRAFADDVDDATGDLIAINLVLAAKRRGTGLSTVLEGLAETVAADVRARRQIEADRAKPRATARWVTIISASVLGFLAFTGDYIAPYRTPLGQVMLALLLAAYVGALVWLKRIATGKPAPRLLGSAALGAPGRAS